MHAFPKSAQATVARRGLCQWSHRARVNPAPCVGLPSYLDRASVNRPLSPIRSIVADTSSVGYTHVTGGSRVTFATGTAVVEASTKVVDELRARAAMIWDVDVEGVIWEDGQAKPASSNVGDFAPLSFKELAAKKALTGGPITAAASVNAGGMAPGFSTQF
jgi:CO/xanthine dehydrogenase Mo-binding subunit